MSGAATIARLRGIAARLIESEEVDAAWFAACLAEFEAGAPLKLTMEQAFGLACTSPGERSWWAIEAQQRRDDLLRLIYAQRFSHLSSRAAAGNLWTELSRYQASAWRSDRTYLSPPAGQNADLFRLLRLDAPLSEGTIRRVLDGSPKGGIPAPVAARG